MRWIGFSLFFLSSSLSAQQEQGEGLRVKPLASLPRLESPLDIEDVVIRGLELPSPVQAPKLKPKPRQYQPLHIQQNKPNPAKKKFKWKDILEVGGGTHESWSVKNSLSIQGPHTHLGFRLNTDVTDGFRPGTGGESSDIQLEWESRRLSRTIFSVNWALKIHEFELPEPDHLFYRGHIRDERNSRLQFRAHHRFENQAQLESFAELHNSSLNDQTQNKFGDDLFRGGFMLSWKSFKSALSLEHHRRGESRSFLSRFFFQNTHHPISPDTRVHWGMGLYVSSYENEFLQKNLFLEYARQNEEDRSIVLSPFIQMDHRLEDHFDVYLILSKFLQAHNFVDQHFQDPLLNRPLDYLRPAENTKFELGFRWKLNRKISFSSAFEHRQLRDSQILVFDEISDNGKLRHSIFDRGYENILRIQAEAFLKEENGLDLGTEWKSGNWKNPKIDFTPFESHFRSHIALFTGNKKRGLRLEYSYLGERRTYPSIVKLPALHSIELSGFAKIYQQMTLNAKIENLLQSQQILLPGYPRPDRRFLVGFQLRI